MRIGVLCDVLQRSLKEFREVAVFMRAVQTNPRFFKQEVTFNICPILSFMRSQIQVHAFVYSTRVFAHLRGYCSLI